MDKLVCGQVFLRIISVFSISPSVRSLIIFHRCCTQSSSTSSQQLQHIITAAPAHYHSSSSTLSQQLQHIITAAPAHYHSSSLFVAIRLHQCKEGNVLNLSSDMPVCASRRNEFRRNINAFLLQKYACTGTNTGNNYL